LNNEFQRKSIVDMLLLFLETIKFILKKHGTKVQHTNSQSITN